MPVIQALMKYYNDPAFLAKLGSKLGDVSALTGGAAAAAGAASPAAAMMGQPAAPEITNLLEAARYVQQARQVVSPHDQQHSCIQ